MAIQDGITILDDIINNKSNQCIIPSNPILMSNTFDKFGNHNIWQVKIPK